MTKSQPPEVSQHDHSEDVDVVQSLPGTNFTKTNWICCKTTSAPPLSSLSKQPEHPDEGLLWDLVDKIQGAHSAYISLPVVINVVNVVVICYVSEGITKKAAVFLDFVQIMYVPPPRPLPPIRTTFFNAKNVDLSDIQND